MYRENENCKQSHDFTHPQAMLSRRGEGFRRAIVFRYHEAVMPYPIKVCVICSEEFELRPDKPGFANRCPECSANEEASDGKDAAEKRTSDKGLNEARRHAIRDLLYRKE
jgi:hypothetical protein